MRISGDVFHERGRPPRGFVMATSVGGLLAVLLVFHAFVDVSLELGTGVGQPGDYVTIALTTRGRATARLQAEIRYDPRQLVFVGGQNGVRGADLDADQSLTVSSLANGGIALAAQDRSGWRQPFGSLPAGELARLTFEVQRAATPGVARLVLDRAVGKGRYRLGAARGAEADGSITVTSAGPPQADSVPPTSPRRVTARAVARDTVEVFWFDSRDDVGVSYRIYRATVTGWTHAVPSSWTTPVLAGTATHSGLERIGFLDTGLLPLTDYIYWVAAVDPDGNESAWKTGDPGYTRFHAAPKTLTPGHTIQTRVTYPHRVAPGGQIVITQTVTCAPACRLGHHDVHWNTRIDDLPPAREQPPFVEDNFTEHSVADQAAATTRTSTARITAPSTPGNFYFMEDAHVFGPGFPLSGAGGNSPHQEGMLFRIVVSDPSRGKPLQIMPAMMPGARVGAAYRLALTVTGEGAGSYAWGVNEGRLPPGLAIDPATGEVAGTPTQAGVWPLSVMVEDGRGTTAFRRYTLTVGPRTSPVASRNNPSSPPWRMPQEGADGKDLAPFFVVGEGADRARPQRLTRAPQPSSKHSTTPDPAIEVKGSSCESVDATRGGRHDPSNELSRTNQTGKVDTTAMH